MKIVNPKIKELEIGNLHETIKTGDLSFFQYEKERILGKYNISDCTIDSCIFKNISFENISFENVELVDVIFENCDLSNKCFDKEAVIRVIFKNCKMTGTTFMDSKLENIQFLEIFLLF